MKNTNSTKKYIIALQAALFVVAFLVSGTVSAQSIPVGGNDPIQVGGNDPIISGGNDPIQVGGNNSLPVGGNVSMPVGGNNPIQVGGNDSSRVVGSGGFVSTYTPLVPQSYYTSLYGSYPSSYTVGTGGFTSSGVDTVTLIPVNYAPGVVGTGGFTSQPINQIVGTNDPLLTASCYSVVNNNQTITWSVSSTGGNGFYNYNWSGDESLSGFGQSITKSYSYAGVKNANVTITSNGQSITRSCSNSVSGFQNQVLAYNDTNTGLQSVYLSDVPYTGAGDTIRVIGFILGLVLWSVLVAYIYLKRKYNLQNIFAPVAKSETPNTEIKISGALAEQSTSDTQDISFVEDYARMKKVLLSSDASVKLVKLQRLGTASAIEIIDKLSKTEWTAVGESDIEAYA